MHGVAAAMQSGQWTFFPLTHRMTRVAVASAFRQSTVNHADEEMNVKAVPRICNSINGALDNEFALLFFPSLIYAYCVLRSINLGLKVTYEKMYAAKLPINQAKLYSRSGFLFRGFN
jgi:hypothetical protein